MEYAVFNSKEEFDAWLNKYCREYESIEKDRAVALEEACDAVDSLMLDELVPVTEEIHLSSGCFHFSRSGLFGFALAMDTIGKKYAGNADIEVRYAKPQNEYGCVCPEIVISNLPLIEHNKKQKNG